MATAKKPTSFFRGPLFWILLAIVVLVPVGASFFSPTTARVDTNVGLELLDEGKVNEAKIYDGEQKVELSLKEDYHQGDQNLGKEVEFYYVKPRAEEVVKTMDEANLEGFTDQPVENNWFLSLVRFLSLIHISEPTRPAA